MDPAWLKEQLAAGRSIESLARETGRPPSTVAYWVNKYGLSSKHAEKHAARGGMERAALEELVASGLSIRAIASTVGLSYTAVRHWLAAYGLETKRAIQARRLASSREEQPDGDSLAECPKHGWTRFRRRANGSWRCLRCRADAVSDRRRAVKAALVREAGGACALCGYDRSAAGLHFHHLDPATKEFHLGYGGFARSLEAARAEAAKCVLLCANCHAEVEAGVATMPVAAAQSPEG